jgi:hypothetical protein
LVDFNENVPDRVDDCHIGSDDVWVVLRVRNIVKSGCNRREVLHQNLHIEEAVGVSRIEVRLEDAQLGRFICGGWEDVHSVLSWLTRGQNVVEEEIDCLDWTS